MYNSSRPLFIFAFLISLGGFALAQSPASCPSDLAAKITRKPMNQYQWECRDQFGHKLEIGFFDTTTDSTSGKRTISGKAQFELSGQGIAQPIRQTANYSGDTWGALITIAGNESHTSGFRQIVVMFDRNMQIRGGTLYHENIFERQMLELHCVPIIRHQ